jgi:signal peptidase I
VTERSAACIPSDPLIGEPRDESLALESPEPSATDADGARAFQASGSADGLVLQPAPEPSVTDAAQDEGARQDGARAFPPSHEASEATRSGFQLTHLKEELVAWVKTLMSAAVYAVLIVTFGFQVARVEGQSMAPTLEDQDRLIVNKLIYRIGEPRRGDIVMLYYPLNPEKSFVKRVIAEEGDTVRIVDGRVYVNDIPLKDDYVSSEYRSHDDWGPQVIPEGYYFVMGDHRNNSSDSRHWGMVPKKYIIGKVQLRWWPVPTARVF